MIAFDLLTCFSQNTKKSRKKKKEEKTQSLMIFMLDIGAREYSED